MKTHFSDYFIQRPVLAWVLNIVVILLGVVSFFQLSVRQYPQVELPVITVTTQFDGAGPEIIETQITRPLEEILAGLEGLDSMTSESMAEQSKIKLSFLATRPIDSAAADVRDRLSRTDKLPIEASHPQITKADADSDSVVSLALYGKKYPVSDLFDYATRYLERDFGAVQGVASIDTYGGATYEMHILLDPVRMAAYNITAQEVTDALKSQNINKPAGRLGVDDREFLVVTKAPLSKPDHFNNLVLGERNGYVVKLSDVGEAKFSSDSKRFRVLYNGEDAIMLGVIAQSRANPIEIAKVVREKLTQVRESLPRGMFVEIANDRSTFIEKSIEQVYRSIWEAIALVVFVVFFFLRSFKASIIPLVTIPISLLGAFFMVYLFGFTINTLTLLAIVLAIGLVVDDAIVVLENIYRKIEEGLSPFKAAILGTREIQFSVIAMTLTLASVYTPISLASGVTGKLFTEFALTLVGAVLWSGFVALVLSPMMCSRLLAPHSQENIVSNEKSTWNILSKINNLITLFLNRLDFLYAKSLRWALSFKWWIAGGAVGLGLMGYFMGTGVLPSELSPREDQGLIRATAQSPVGATLSYLDRYARQIDTAFASIPQMDKRLLIIQAGEETFERGMLVPWEKRGSCQSLIPSLQEQLNEIPGFRAFAYCPSRSLMGGASERPLEIVIQTNKSFKELVSTAGRIRKLMARFRGIRSVDIDWDLAAEGKEYIVTIKRDIASASGINIQNLATTLDMLIAGRRATSFEKESKLYPVRVWMGESNRRSPDDLRSLMIKGSRNNKEVMIPLQDLVNIEEKLSNPAINHHTGMRSVSIMAGLEKGYGLGDVYGNVRPEILNALPTGFMLKEKGELKRYLTEQQTVYLIFALAVTFIFLVMAAQFESFRDPLIIMFSVPLALTGAILTLWLIPAGSINIYSQIGFITLVGLITKHGILIVDFANGFQEKGIAPLEAIIKACQERLRAILMTTFAMVLGSLPLALGGGPGSELRRQIGWVIVGGMSVGTFFTLFVIPAMYLLISKRHLGKKNEFETL